MSDDFTSILPSTSMPWERAVEKVSGERWSDLDIDILRRARDPWTCPEHLLPYLAHQRSVDVWDERWSVDKKRQVIADAPEDHHLKTTAEGIERYIRHAGGELLRIIAPPQGLYLVDEMTDEERAGYLSRLDQIRIYRHYPMDLGGDGFFADDACWDDGWLDSEPPGHGYRKHAVLRRHDGSETDLDISWTEVVTEAGGSTEIERVLLPCQPDAGFYADGDCWDIGCLDVDGLADRTIEISTPAAYAINADRTMIGAAMPAGLASGALPELVSEQLPGDGRGLMLDAGYWDDAWLSEDQSWRHIYERIYLADPERHVPSMDAAGSYWDDAWLDWEPFTAVLQVRQTARYAMTGAETCWDEGFFLPDDLDDHRVLLEAVASAEALHDRVYVLTTTYREPRLGDRLKLDGSWSIGQLIEDR